jgi:hypothetical protein
MTLWNKIRDERWIMPANVYPRLRARATTLLRCDDSVNAVQNVILQWHADELEKAASEEHTYVAPDLFTAETPLGLYQGVTEQVVISRTPGSFRTVLVPRGSSKPDWES